MEGADDQAPVVAWMEHHQVVLYLGALVAGAVLGLAAPAASSLLEAAISPVLVTLLFQCSCSSRPSSCHCGWPSLPAHPELREVVSAGDRSRRPSSS